MSVDQHRSHAVEGALRVRVLVVSSTRTVETDESGPLIRALVEAAGHRVGDVHVVPDDVGLISAEVRGWADGAADVVLVTGGTGLSGRDVTPEALMPLFRPAIPGFGELFRQLSFAEIGVAALLSRACAGVVGQAVVFAMPGSVAACKLAVERLILPELGHLVAQVRRERDGAVVVADPIAPPPGVEAVADAVWEDVPEDRTHDATESADGPKLPAPTGRLGQLGGGKLDVSLSQQLDPAAAAPGDAPDGLDHTGWKRAVYEVSGEILFDKREELPQPIEKLASVVDGLHQAGETAVLRLPSGVRYSLWGFPDLRRPGSKVLAVGWGDPLAEVLALHRYPVMTGTCVDGGHGQLPDADSPVTVVCEAVVGSAPKDSSGRVFAVQGDAVFIERAGKVFRWDGRQERAEGNIKQALASLVLAWSSR